MKIVLLAYLVAVAVAEYNHISDDDELEWHKFKVRC